MNNEIIKRKKRVETEMKNRNIVSGVLLYWRTLRSFQIQICKMLIHRWHSIFLNGKHSRFLRRRRKKKIAKTNERSVSLNGTGKAPFGLRADSRWKSLQEPGTMGF